MKASLPEVNQLTGKCFQMVRIVTKNNFFAIKISQRHDWETPSLCNYFLLTSTEINNDVFFFSGGQPSAVNSRVVHGNSMLC